jgi:hypothetical protein
MKHPNWDHVTDLHELMSILDERFTQLAHVNESRAIRSEFHEDTEVCDADDQGREHRAWLEPIHRGYIASKGNWVLKFASIGERKLQGSRNREKLRSTNLPAPGKLIRIDSQCWPLHRCFWDRRHICDRTNH